MVKEFKAFIMRGNVLDLGVAVIMGAAFSPIVTSLVNDILMPPLGLILNDVDFKELFLVLSDQSYPTLAAAKEAGAPVIAYGNFLNTIVSFLIVSFVVFLLVTQANRLQAQPAPAAPMTKECAYCHLAIPIPAVRCPYCTSDLSRA